MARPNVDYTKFDSLAADGDREEEREKEEVRRKHRDDYFQQQAEKIARHKAKTGDTGDAHGHGHGGGGHGHGHGGPPPPPPPPPAATAGAAHGHAHGPGHTHTHTHTHDAAGSASSSSSSSTSTPASTSTSAAVTGSTSSRGPAISRAPTCGCGYVDPDELKRMAREAKLRPVESQEDKNRKKRAAVEDAKERGNKLFKLGNYQDAIAVYQFGIDVIWQAVGMSESEWPAVDMEKMEVTLTLNIATSRLMLKDNTECVNCCNTALRLDGKSFKAFYRRAEARLAMGELEQAREDFLAAQRIEPSNKQVAAALVALVRSKEEQKAKEKKFQQEMGERMRAAAAAAATTATATASTAGAGTGASTVAVPPPPPPPTATSSSSSSSSSPSAPPPPAAASSTSPAT